MMKLLLLSQIKNNFPNKNHCTIFEFLNRVLGYDYMFLRGHTLFKSKFFRFKY